MFKRAAPFAALLSRHAVWLFALPPAFGVAAKLSRSKLWFTDYEAVACAGQKVLAGHPIYDLNLACPGMHAASFVYLPGVAQSAAALQSVFGPSGFFLLYLGCYLAAVAALTLLPLRAAPLADGRAQIPFLSFLSGSAFMGGNIAVLLHGGVLLAALAWLESAPWLVVAVIVVAAWVKPVFLAYLALILLADLSWRRRAGMMACGVAAGLAPSLIFALSGGDLAHQWMSLLAHFVYDETPGRAWFGWLQMAGVEPDSLSAKAGYFAYAAALTGAVLALSRMLDLNRRERLWLGFSLAVLLIPRLMSEDVFLLGPGLILVAGRATAAGLTPRGDAVVAALCCLCLGGGLTEMADVTTPLALLGFALYLMWAAFGLGLRSLRPMNSTVNG
ncbi:MAG TPA: hypothetical protein VF402_05620 [Asticcacaulis sp.]